jgi:hypothetical protein
MARPVRSLNRATGVWDIPPMPEMIKAGDVYETCLGGRLKAFPLHKEETVRNKDPTWPSGFRHRLRYDAESIFWLLLWWTTLACPETDTDSEYRFEPANIWKLFTCGDDEVDERSMLLFPVPSKLVHPDYKSLIPLLQAMAYQLPGDPDASDDLLKKDEEYLHEVFQRLVLEFLIENYDAEFLNLKKKAEPRALKPQPDMNIPLSTTQIETSRSTRPSGSQHMQSSVSTRSGSKRKRAAAFGGNGPSPAEPARKKVSAMLHADPIVHTIRSLLQRNANRVIFSSVASLQKLGIS